MTSARPMPLVLPLDIREASPIKWEDTTAPVAASRFPISALQVVSSCRPPIRHNSKMLHCRLSGSVARGLAGESAMPCEALCTPQLHGIVAVRPSRLRLQHCLEAANLRLVSASVEAKSTQAQQAFDMNQRFTACQISPQSTRDGVYIKESF